MKITDEVRAQVYRELADGLDKDWPDAAIAPDGLRSLADQYDTQAPELGAVVWWKYPSAKGWEIARVHRRGSPELGIYNLVGDFVSLKEIEWKPAYTSGADEVIIKKSLAENAWAALVETSSYGSAKEIQRAIGQQEPKDFFVPAPEHRADPILKPRRR